MPGNGQFQPFYRNLKTADAFYRTRSVRRPLVNNFAAAPCGQLQKSAAENS